MYDNIAFALREKNFYIKKTTKIFGGKKYKGFQYIYPKSAFIFIKDQDFTYQMAIFNELFDEINISLRSKQVLHSRILKWFGNNPRHKAVVITWKKVIEIKHPINENAFINE